MKCPSCNKFAAYDTSNEPEFELDVDSELETFPHNEGDELGENKDKATANITGTCRIVLTSECCGDELKESTFEIEISDVEIERFVPTEKDLSEGKKPCTCDLTELEAEGSAEIDSRMELKDPRTGKPIKPRYAKTFYGASGTIEVHCACGESKATEDWSDEVQAGAMDELT